MRTRLDYSQDTGNKISRASKIIGAKHIVLSGKCVISEGVVVRGDLVRPAEPKSSAAEQSKSKPTGVHSVHLGRYVFVSSDCVLRPPSRLSSIASRSGESSEPQHVYYPLRIYDHVFIGPRSTIQAAEIRSNVYIGARVTVGNMVIIKDNVKVLDGAVLPANSVWPSNSIVGGVPARVVGELAEGWGIGSSSAAGQGGWEDMIGVRARDRWASVGNKK